MIVVCKLVALALHTSPISCPKVIGECDDSKVYKGFRRPLQQTFQLLQGVKDVFKNSKIAQSKNIIEGFSEAKEAWQDTLFGKFFRPRGIVIWPKKTYSEMNRHLKKVLQFSVEYQ